MILANLVLGENVVPEFLQRDCTRGSARRGFAAIVGRYAANAAARSPPLPGSTTSWRLGRGAPSDRAAAVVLELCRAR